MPALRRLDPLPTHELAIRLFYLYDHFRREPVVDSFPDGTQVAAMHCSIRSMKLASTDMHALGVEYDLGSQQNCEIMCFCFCLFPYLKLDSINGCILHLWW